MSSAAFSYFNRRHPFSFIQSAPKLLFPLCVKAALLGRLSFRRLLREVANFSIGGRHESFDLGSGVVSHGNSRAGPLLRVPCRLRKYVGRS